MNTDTQPTPLARQQLGRFIGGQVQVVQPLEYRHGEAGRLESVGDRTVTVFFNDEHGVFRGFYSLEDIRPVLRPISAVTDAEWRAFFGDGCRVLERQYPDHTTLDAWGEDCGWFRMTIDDDGCISIKDRDKEVGPAVVKFAPLIDYLDELGVDCRGYLENGQAVSPC